MSGPEWGSFMSGSESGSEGFYSEPKSVGEAKVGASFWGGPENGREEGFQNWQEKGKGSFLGLDLLFYFTLSMVCFNSINSVFSKFLTKGGDTCS